MIVFILSLDLSHQNILFMSAEKCATMTYQGLHVVEQRVLIAIFMIRGIAV